MLNELFTSSDIKMSTQQQTLFLPLVQTYIYTQNMFHALSYLKTDQSKDVTIPKNSFTILAKLGGPLTSQFKEAFGTLRKKWNLQEGPSKVSPGVMDVRRIDGLSRAGIMFLCGWIYNYHLS